MTKLKNDLTKEVDAINNQITLLEKKKKTILDKNKHETDKALDNIENNIIDMVAKFNQIAKKARVTKRIAYCVADCSNVFKDELVPENWEPEYTNHVSSNIKTSVDAEGWFSGLEESIVEDLGWRPSSQEC